MLSDLFTDTQLGSCRAEIQPQVCLTTIQWSLSSWVARWILLAVKRKWVGVTLVSETLKLVVSGQVCQRVHGG